MVRTEHDEFPHQLTCVIRSVPMHTLLAQCISGEARFTLDGGPDMYSSGPEWTCDGQAVVAAGGDRAVAELLRCF